MKTSTVITLLDLVFQNANSSTSHSYERLNHAMQTALSLAIGSGFEFDLDDVCYVREHYRSSRWLGDSDEWIYSEAIAVGNLSAIRSYEAAKGREGIIADDVDLNITRNAYLHLSGTRKRERLCVGATFTFGNERPKVTSFAEDGSYVNACLYTKVDEYREKISKRLKISRIGIIEDRKARSHAKG